MRPRSIAWFERLYLSSLVVSFLTVVLNYSSLREYSVSRGGAAATSLLVATVTLFVNLAFWFLIARRAQNWAKWVLTVLTVIGIVSMIPASSAGAYSGLGPAYVAFSILALALNIAAVFCLFRADASHWFASRGQTVVDPAVFD